MAGEKKKEKTMNFKVIFMKEIDPTANSCGRKEQLNTLTTATSISPINFMEKESSPSLKVPMKENSKMALKMDKESTNTATVFDTKVDTNKATNMDWESYSISTIPQLSRVLSQMISPMA